MAVLVPAVQPFEAFTGSFTVQPDRASIAIGPSPEVTVATPPYDLGPDATLSLSRWSGTAVGTVFGRSSSARPVGSDDTALILPDSSEWQIVYDPTLGTLPSAQGWGVGGTPPNGSEYTFVNGLLRITKSGSYDYRRFPAGITQSRMVMLHYSITVHAATTHQAEIYFGHSWGDTKRYNHMWKGSAYGALNWVHNAGNIPYTADVHYDVWQIMRYDPSYTRTTADVWWRARGGADQDTINGGVHLGKTDGSATGQDIILFGNFSGGFTDLSWGPVRVWYGSEWEQVSNGDTSFAINRRFWQLKGWENGTLTELDLQSDLTPPGNPATPEIGAVGDTAVGANCVGLATGASAYWVECIDDDTDAVVGDGWELIPSKTFRDLPAGNYRVEFTSASDDGVRGSTVAATPAIPLPTPPIPTPTVVITVSADEVQPGEESDLHLEITGDVDVTVGATPVVDGETLTVVTGVSAPGVTPPGAFTLSPARYPLTFRLGKTGGTMEIYDGGAGSAVRSTVRLYVATSALGTYALDATQTTNPINFSSLTFSGSPSKATNHGWTLNSSKWYKVGIVDTDGRETIAGPVSGAAQADYEVTVTGTLPTSKAGRLVRIRMDAPVKAGSKTYPADVNPVTVGSDGTWSVTLPRGATAYFLMPGSRVEDEVTLPNVASATYESLT